MTYIYAVVLGIIEGLTEFLPISSTAHLILAGEVLGIPSSEFLKSFDIAIQLGAICSVIVLFARSFLDFEVLKRLAIAFVPTGIAATGYDLFKNASTFTLENISVLAVGFVVSFVVAILAIKFLLSYVRTHTFVSFGIYRILAAAMFWLILIV